LKFKVSILAIAFMMVPRAGQAQATPSACVRSDTLRFTSWDLAGETADLARLAELDGNSSVHSHMLQRSSTATSVATCAADPSPLIALARHFATREREGLLSFTPMRIRALANSAYATDRNNGALWAGRGLSAEVSGGIKLRAGVFSAAIVPVLAYQQNAAFDIVPVFDPNYSVYSTGWRRSIDYPQRFGDKSFATFDPGQSYARADYKGFGAGVSTENLWWGPSRRNPIIMSNTAAGVPHIFLETSRPRDIWIGTGEFMVFAGRLEESDFFDKEPENDVRFLSGIAGVFKPRGIDGLYVGGSRVEHAAVRPEDLSITDLLFGPYRGITKNETGDNQILSLFFRWAAPAAAFEVFGEWARDDHWGTRELLILAPDASQAYTIGLQKLLTFGSRRLRLTAETTHLEDANPILHAGRAVLTYYTHSEVIQGHTQRGQILGASIGPGSEAQFVGADLFWKYGRTGLNLERVRYDADTYHAVWSSAYGPFNAHDVELTATATQAMPVGPLLVNGALGYSYRYNRSFLGLDGVNRDYLRESNWSLDVTATLKDPRQLFH
jgi:hypothetical protein